MNIISGSNGFIGSHLLKHIDATPIPHKDIQSSTFNDVDTFYFLSSYGNMADQTEDEKIMQANVADLISVLNQITKQDIHSFVFISTSSVKLRRQTMYSRSKRSAEEIVLAYMEKHNKPMCIIRPFSVTGVGEQKAHLIPQLIESCMDGKLINFVPNPKHDYIDVDDVVSAILSLSKRRARGFFEVGSGKSYSNQQILEIVEKVTGKKANVNIVPSMRPYDTDEWVSTNFRARGFGWEPTKTIEQSIVEMVKAYGNS